MTRIKFLSACLAFVLTLTSLASLAQLTANSKVGLITVGPGKEVFTAFGHSALHISDPNLGLDNIYNYGTFSFANGFYLKFTKGEMDFWLSVIPFHQEYYSWTTLENRSVTEQILNLSTKQKSELFQFLEKNALPENSVYRYDYFYDNCSNRIDNALKQVLGDSLKLYPMLVAKKQNRIGATIRQLTHSYLLQDAWGELGIETCLGIDMDEKITPEQFKFLPDFLMWNYDVAKIQSDGILVPLVKEKTVLFKKLEAEDKSFLQNLLTPASSFGFIFALALLFSFPVFYQTIFSRIFDFLLFLISGLVGLLILYLWFFTTHHSQVNLNIVWANPVNFFVSFLFFSRMHNTRLAHYHLIYGSLLILFLAFWTASPQQINNAYISIFLSLIVRCFANYWFCKENKNIYKLI